MTSESELEQTDKSTSQSKEGHGSSYKEGAQEKKKKEGRERRETA